MRRYFDLLASETLERNARRQTRRGWPGASMVLEAEFASRAHGRPSTATRRTRRRSLATSCWRRSWWHCWYLHWRLCRGQRPRGRASDGRRRGRSEAPRTRARGAAGVGRGGRAAPGFSGGNPFGEQSVLDPRLDKGATRAAWRAALLARVTDPVLGWVALDKGQEESNRCGCGRSHRHRRRAGSRRSRKRADAAIRVRCEAEAEDEGEAVVGRDQLAARQRARTTRSRPASSTRTRRRSFEVPAVYV